MKVNNIESGVYCGYYWMSDESDPHTLINEDFAKSLEAVSNPFIVEAQLYDETKKVSYSLKYVDGEYVVHRWDGVSSDMIGEEYSLVQYYANRVGDDKNMPKLRLKFLQHWVAEPDEACDNKPVLQPKELIFVGF